MKNHTLYKMNIALLIASRIMLWIPLYGGIMSYPETISVLPYLLPLFLVTAAYVVVLFVSWKRKREDAAFKEEYHAAVYGKARFVEITLDVCFLIYIAMAACEKIFF